MKIVAGFALFLASVAFAQQPSPAPTATLSLRQAVAEAVLRNPNRVRAAHEVTAAGFERDAAEWGRFPTVSVDAGATHSSASSIAPTSTVRVEQPLWAGGRIDGQIDSARAQVSAAQLAELDTRRRLAEETAVAYVGWMDAAARVEIARESAVALAQLVEYVRRRESEGLASLADVSIGKARYSSALALVEEMSGALEQARAQLEALMVTRIERGIPVNVPAVPDRSVARTRARADWAAHLSSRRQVEELEPQVAALDDSMASFRRQFEAGRKSWLELLNTQREVVDSRIALSRARTSRDQSALRLMVNTGTFWPWLEKLPQ